MEETEEDDIAFTYPAQDKIEVFCNNAGGITIRSSDYWSGEEVVMLNPDAARLVLRALQELIPELELEENE